MSRARIYRGKRNDNGEWIKGYLWVGADHVYITPYNLGVDYNNETHRITACAYEVVRETVGQYTGLTDKNGKKIFEGDIIKSKKYGKIIGHSNVNDYDIFEVIYKPAVFRLENMHRVFTLVGISADYEVIGNIHDNPELLEGGNDR